MPSMLDSCVNLFEIETPSMRVVGENEGMAVL